MAVVLGPELDGFLRGIGEDLKGKTKVNYVDQETLIRACSAQNKVILLLQEQMLRMQEVERGMQRSLATLEDKVSSFEKYIKKVDDIEDVLMEKIPLVDKMNEVVKDHNIRIERHETEFKEHVSDFDSFREEAKDEMSQTMKDITMMKSQINMLPKTIVISSRQVTHSIDDEGGSNLPPDGKELLVDVIAQQEQHAYLQDENTKNIQEQLNQHVADQERRNMKVDGELSGLTKWKVEQSSVDLAKMKASQDAMEDMINNHQGQISTKMSMQDVNKKLDLQFKDIVEHLQSALASVEKDEGDFRSITDTLSNMCKSLRENKADKSEINALRKQFIQNQIQMEDDFGGALHSSGSTLDNESLRKILKDYSTKTTLSSLMKTKVDKKKAMDEFTRIHIILQSMSGTLKNIAASTADVVLTEHAHDFELGKFDDDDIVLVEDQNGVCVTSFDSVYKRTIEEPSEGEDISRTPNESQTGQGCETLLTTKQPAMTKNRLYSKRKTGSKRRLKEGASFPSSSFLNSSLGNIPPNEEALKRYQRNKTIENTGDYLKAEPIRPASAPNSRRESPLKHKKLTKKNSLPAILTSISKSIRPRSRMRSRRRDKAERNIHNGSFQIIPSSPRNVVLDNSSSRFSDLPPVQEDAIPQHSRPNSTSSEDGGNRGIQIRTSIA